MPVLYRRQVEERLRELAKLLQRRREQLGLTQERLAEELRVSPMTLQFVEQGRRFPSLPTLFYFLTYLDIEMTFELPSRTALLRAAEASAAPKRRSSRRRPR